MHPWSRAISSYLKPITNTHVKIFRLKTIAHTLCPWEDQNFSISHSYIYSSQFKFINFIFNILRQHLRTFSTKKVSPRLIGLWLLEITIITETFLVKSLTRNIPKDGSIQICGQWMMGIVILSNISMWIIDNNLIAYTSVEFETWSMNNTELLHINAALIS